MEFVQYVIPSRHYRDGVLYEPGSIVTIPDDEEPGRGWEKYSPPVVEEAPADPLKPPTDPGKKGKRASDKDL